MDNGENDTRVGVLVFVLRLRVCIALSPVLVVGFSRCIVAADTALSLSTTVTIFLPTSGRTEQ